MRVRDPLDLNQKRQRIGRKMQLEVFFLRRGPMFWKEI